MRAEAAALDPYLPERIEAETRRYEGRLVHLQEAVLDALLGPAVLVYPLVERGIERRKLRREEKNLERFER